MSTSRAVIAYVFFCVGAVIAAPLLGHVALWWCAPAGASIVAGTVSAVRRCWKAVTR